MRRIFILVPSLHPTGPVKGAVALANALSRYCNVTLVALKPGPGVGAPVNDSVRVVRLDARLGIRGRISECRRLIADAASAAEVASISFCFSADLANRVLASRATTIASVRGNLPQNYRHDYGLPGLPFAALHLLMLRGVHWAVAMTEAMADQMTPFVGYRPPVIRNFIDEAHLEGFRSAAPPTGPIRIVFLGSLSRRKQPQLLLTALRTLLDGGQDARADVIGSGPLQPELQRLTDKLRLGERVVMHGQLTNPYYVLAGADALVLPSLSEGIPRAGLEALFLGVPCVLRDSDGNAELIRPIENGALFKNNSELPDAILAAAQLSRKHGTRLALLPPEFRQAEAAERYLALAEGAAPDASVGEPHVTEGAL